jgi:hypothetical protein
MPSRDAWQYSEASSIVIEQCRSMRFFFFCALVSLLGLCALDAAAQEGADFQGEVQLSIASFGVGGLAREGDWAGIQVQLLDLGTSGRDIVLRMSIRDEDGDQTQYDRVVTANPGALQSFWLYCWIPYRGANLEYELKAYEAIDTGNTDVGEFGFRAGRLIGRLPVYNPQVQESSVGLAGVIGNNQLSLDQYGFTLNGRPAMLFGHELLRTSAGLGIDNLPDRWQGLVSLDSIVWANAGTAVTAPGRLSPEKARAISTWVERGGHLVIVLPSSGDPWYIGSHPLRSLLPAVSVPQRHEGVDLDEYRSLLTESTKPTLPDNAVVYTFEPLSGQSEELAIPILNGPDGKCVVIRRLVGSGMVTVIGLPLNNGQLRRVGLPEPEAFWHRVLGLRGNILRLDQMSDQQKTDTGNREIRIFDDGISGSIAKTGRAVQGVLFGIIVFVLYWIIAGPGGYALLKARNKKQHAWMAFIVTTGAFTAVAWLGATAMRPKSTNILHLSLLEQVYGQDTQRARTWMSVMLPSYGSAVVSLRPPTESSAFSFDESSDLLSPWTSPESLTSLTKGFPDNSGYRVESKNPSAIRVPTRATVKSFQVQWSGEPRWAMPRPVGVPGALEEPQLSIDGTVVIGKLAHDLPVSLKHVRIFVISGEIPIRQPGVSLSRMMIARTSVYAPNFGDLGWAPGQEIDMELLTRLSTTQRESIQNNYFATALRYGVNQSGLGQQTGNLIDRLMAGRFLSQLEPPRYGAKSNDVVGNRLALRRALHGWDLGRWFTEPTLIIMGVIDIPKNEADPDGLPIPLWVNDRQVPASGKTLVTWIYPFGANPPRYLGLSQPAGETKTEGASDANAADE